MFLPFSWYVVWHIKLFWAIRMQTLPCRRSPTLFEVHRADIIHEATVSAVVYLRLLAPGEPRSRSSGQIRRPPHRVGIHVRAAVGHRESLSVRGGHLDDDVATDNVQSGLGDSPL